MWAGVNRNCRCDISGSVSHKLHANIVTAIYFAFYFYYTYIQIFAYTYIQTYLFVRICFHSSRPAFTFENMHTTIQICMCIYLYIIPTICMCACGRVCVCIHFILLKYGQKVHLRESVYVANSYLCNFVFVFSNFPASSHSHNLALFVARVK